MPLRLSKPMAPSPPTINPNSHTTHQKSQFTQKHTFLETPPIDQTSPFFPTKTTKLTSSRLISYCVSQPFSPHHFH